MEKLGLERNYPNITTLSAVGSVYEAAFPAKNGYLHHNALPYSGWVSVSDPNNKGMNVVSSTYYTKILKKL